MCYSKQKTGGRSRGERWSRMKEKAYSGVAALPTGQYTGPLTPGCMVLEGGAFRGVYTSGVLDALLQAGIQMQCTIGVSAGALTGLNYVAGQIGRRRAST